MSTFLVPVVVITLAITSLLILSWLVYPFLLRYRIENAFGLFNSNLQNGANGSNGAHGENAPERRNGSNGAHGANSQAGLNGADGLSGTRGLQGISGHDGDGGEDGEDGEDGVPGFNVVQVCSKMFGPTGPGGPKNLYYVNGKQIGDHVETLAVKSTKLFDTQKLRLKDRIQNNFKLESDKIYFSKVLDKILETNIASGTTNKLDTHDLFNTFLDLVKTTFTAQSATLKNSKDAELIKIEQYNANLKDLRTKRDADLAKLDSIDFKDEQRFWKLSYLLPITEPIFLTKYTDLQATPTLTIDKVISDLSGLIIPQQTIFNSTNSTAAEKTTAAAEISLRTEQINKLKNVKYTIVAENTVLKNLILNAYKAGTDISATPIDIPNSLTYIVVFSDYSTPLIVLAPSVVGADALKTAIITSNNVINAAVTLCQTNLETVIAPYKSANSIP